MGDASLSEGGVVVLAAAAAVFGGVVSGVAGLQAAMVASARTSEIFLTSIGVHPLRRAAKVYSSPAVCPVVAPGMAVPVRFGDVGLSGSGCVAFRLRIRWFPSPSPVMRQLAG
ncbi:hypothetical protein CVO74_01465 [Xanthomonas prunicola]|uniref:Uncharacterized protein n=2 Tax=Xanthomonas prunicola TaxID=2053930 RepID=A0A2N3RPG3_9XANT|nr:hypothetical protein XpruCFBP8353_04990 [Xanthomonas prunicola]PKV18687.1 hypothetical protein XpruCFBP8354_04990 [Xanthomonas prunicola]PKV22004.1 hypothetical protein CVO74_01465 [Xanthomonas prunicola]